MSDYKPDPLGIIGYSPSTGDFTWLQAGPGRRPGLSAGCRNGNRYVMIQYGRKTVPAHRLAWRIMTGKWPENEIDHINRDKGDNRFENLREAERFENARNVGKTRRNTSGYKGVTWEKRRRVWVANIGYEGKLRYLGTFPTREEAYSAYVAAAKKFHGEFHCVE